MKKIIFFYVHIFGHIILFDIKKNNQTELCPAKMVILLGVFYWSSQRKLSKGRVNISASIVLMFLSTEGLHRDCKCVMYKKNKDHSNSISWIDTKF